MCLPTQDDDDCGTLSTTTTSVGLGPEVDVEWYRQQVSKETHHEASMDTWDLQHTASVKCVS